MVRIDAKNSFQSCIFFRFQNEFIKKRVGGESGQTEGRKQNRIGKTRQNPTPRSSFQENLANIRDTNWSLTNSMKMLNVVIEMTKEEMGINVVKEKVSQLMKRWNESYPMIVELRNASINQSIEFHYCQEFFFFHDWLNHAKGKCQDMINKRESMKENLKANGGIPPQSEIHRRRWLHQERRFGREGGPEPDQGARPYSRYEYPQIKETVQK